MDIKVVVERGEDGGFVAHVPALRGCWSQGSSGDVALINIREAIGAWLETEQDKMETEPQSGEVALVPV